MPSYVRNDAWNEGGTLSNPDLLWYAKGVGKMMSRKLDDPASWWFFAAMHGEYVNTANPWYPSPPSFPGWGYISSPPQVPTQPLPVAATQDRFWNQCQHGSWYFLPWHRGYLMALEAQLRADIVSLGGPANWALPYWNYFGGEQGADAEMPPAFAQQNLPDGSANPLFVTMRYGPDGDGDIYVPTDLWAENHGPDDNWTRGEVTAACQNNTVYTGSNQATPLPGYGGPESGFSHDGGPHGNMESDPHDLVHVYTGGTITNTNYGLMADPGTAALDPIFYLHHCNIDRMWASWNEAGNTNPSSPEWLKGPVRQFVMPMPNSESWVYTPADMTSLAALNYSYQDLSVPAKPTTAPLLMRLKRLGVAVAPDAHAAAVVTSRAPTHASAELLGASAGAIDVQGAGTAVPVTVQLDAVVEKRVTQSLAAASLAAPPDRVYLKLENVRGTLDSTVLCVYVNLPAGADTPDQLRAHHVGDVALFGLRRASARNGAHGGSGLTFVLDITPSLDQQYLAGTLSNSSLDVSLLPARKLPAQSTIEVGRVSVYRQPN
ncbi:tyrosinase family protein [Paraburkholderia bannensis]|uniref:tyrosinase family protein n=1 Tax=Paraburkholderia bannensis TaxID=765414 RepID=UPI002AB1E573|nr:tyrosinase family protein [Paraburkholderia bannensis]